MQQATKVNAEKKNKVSLDLYSGYATGRDGHKYFPDKPADVLICPFSVQISGRITVLYFNSLIMVSTGLSVYD
jgi:hypothetical protein